MSNEMAAGLSLCQASEQIDCTVVEIERLLVTLALLHRTGAAPIVDREPTTGDLR